MDTRIVLAVLFVVVFQSVSSFATPGSTDQSIQCGKLTCSINSKCKNDTLHYRCQCQAGFQGETCSEDRDECAQGAPCGHRGQCHNAIGSWWCECLDGWNGTEHCGENITESRLCMPGWSGEWCETCLDDELGCGYQGKCRLLHNGDYTCSCQSGYRGKPCSDVDECSTRHPCKNSGSCVNTVGSYICTCASGWTGATCSDEIDECSSNPCQHQGVCKDYLGYYSCNCTEGWDGNNCDTDVNECARSNICNGTLVCVNTDGGYECRSKDDSGGSNIGIIAGVTTGIIFAILIFVVLALLFNYKWKRSSRKIGNVNRKDL